MSSAAATGQRDVADLRTVDLLAQLKLATGAVLVVKDPELRSLIAFCGLAEALGIEPGREPEEREQGLGVEEEAELDDPVA